jgi:serine/threonine protein kinase
VDEVTPVGPELLPGALLADRYRIERLLGQGDRKRTYLAQDTYFARTVAISVVRPEAVLLDPEGTRRESEALAWVSDNDNVVSFFDAGLQGPYQFMVFQYLSGGTLADLIAETASQGAKLPADYVLKLARQLCRGLAYLHEVGLIHRDVSPQNIWLDQRREAHLGDFDPAVLAEAPDGGRPITTLAYASPEERRGGHIDGRSDLFSLGMVLMAAASGDLRCRDADEVRKLRPALPGSFVDLLARLVAHDPDERPDGAVAVLRALERVPRATDLYAPIDAGEGPHVEFKSSFRWPTDLSPKMPKDERRSAIQRLGPMLEKEALKTIAAFLNTDGGTLLIGVQDDGTILGIEPDLAVFDSKKQNLDAWQLYFKDVVISSMGADVWSTLQLSFDRTDSGTVARVQCAKRDRPTYLTIRGDEYFYCRTASASESLPVSRAHAYITDHWANGR